MSDVQGATEEIQKLQLDEVTGERVSKTELKKRQKARDKEAKKAEKEASKQPPPPPKRKAVSQDEEESNLPANVSSATSLTAISDAFVLHSAPAARDCVGLPTLQQPAFLISPHRD